MKYLIFIFLILLNSCGEQTYSNDIKKLHGVKEQEIVILPSSFRTIISIVNYENHSYIVYGYGDGSLTHNPDCTNPKCQCTCK
jgi:hypothetical protein